jgi:hypothetical protein
VPSTTTSSSRLEIASFKFGRSEGIDHSVRFSEDFVLGFLYSGFLPAGPIKCLRDSLQRNLDLGGCTTLLKPNALISKVTFRKARFSANPVRQLMWTGFLVNLHRLLPEPAKDYSRVV